jgi:SNF2 family DNA or RNA helicase
MENKKKPEETGWYVPQSLLDMGLLPANLEDYDPEPNDRTPSGLKLRRYQARTVTFLRQTTTMREGNLLWADPGLGKTVSSLQANWLDGYLQRPGLIVGPNIAKGVWCDDDSDAKVHYNLTVLSLEGMKNIDPGFLEHHNCFFCHYEILQAWQPWIFATLKPAWMILDESHFLIHQKAQRSKAARQLALCNTIERRFCLTGTAIPNERLDLWNQVATCQPRQWGPSHHDFGVRYCGGQRMAPEDGGHWTYEGESNTDELRARLAGTVLRYTTEEVGDELPPMERHVIEAEGIEEHLLDDYSLAQRDTIGYLKLKGKIPDEAATITLGNTTIKLSKNDRKPGAARLVCLTTLIGILSEMKQAAAIKAVISILGQHNRLVVFTWRRKTAEYIYDKIAGMVASGVKISGKSPMVYGPVHGEMDMKERKALAKEFAKDECSIYIATMGSAGTSINTLSAASACLLVDLHWNTSQLRQAEKRVHRDGCTAEKVDIYYLVVRQTVDDLFIEKLEQKAREAMKIAPRDESDLSLVRDLTPEKASGEFDFELLCARLMDYDAEWEEGVMA